jgi:hypothetical protein
MTTSENKQGTVGDTGGCGWRFRSQLVHRWRFLLIIQNGLRCGFVQFELRAHFL